MIGLFGSSAGRALLTSSGSDVNPNTAKQNEANYEFNYNNSIALK